MQTRRDEIVAIIRDEVGSIELPVVLDAAAQHRIRTISTGLPSRMGAGKEYGVQE